MSNLPDLLRGSITEEYGQLSWSAQAEKENETDTCGSDCSGDRDCEEGVTCLQQEEEEAKDQAYRAKTFLPAVEGWNEPPAARL